MHSSAAVVVICDSFANDKYSEKQCPVKTLYTMINPVFNLFVYVLKAVYNSVCSHTLTADEINLKLHYSQAVRLRKFLY
jgi:hypothetical protein